MLAVHLLFAFLHWLQTHLYYDGLAADVPELSALGSVALMLMVVLVLDAPRRGLFLGRPVKKRVLMKRVLARTHGYIFLWALIYTFWYHPTVDSPGHLVGFFYILLLLWQSVLLFQRSHLDRRWTIFLELLVIPHAAFVAWHQGSGLVPMFVFGFSSVFVLTQLYGLGWSHRSRQLVWGLFIIVTVLSYTLLHRWEHIFEILRIPALDYGVVAIIWLAFLAVEKMFRPKNSEVNEHNDAHDD